MSLLEQLKTKDLNVLEVDLKIELEKEEHHARQNEIELLEPTPQFITDDEHWRPIKGYYGIYLVSNLGRVYKRPYKHLNKRKTKDGIVLPKWKKNVYTIDLTNIDGTKATYNLSTLVGQAFLPEHKGKYDFYHLNGNPRDVRAVNLKS